MNAIIRISRAEQGVCKLFSQFSASLSIRQWHVHPRKNLRLENNGSSENVFNTDGENEILYQNIVSNSILIL